MKQAGSLPLLFLLPVSYVDTTTQYWSSDGTRPSTVTLLLVDSIIIFTQPGAVDDTLYLYPVTQGDDDSVQEISTDELVKVSVWIVTLTGLLSGTIIMKNKQSILHYETVNLLV